MKDKRFQIGKWVAILGIVIGLAVYLGYCIKIFQLMQMDSDYSNLILEASDILHGNFFMNGWTQTGISFFTTDMLYYLIAVAFIGICQESYWIASGIMLFCVVFCGYLLMNCGQKSWKKRILEFVIFAGICAVPSLLGVNLLRAHTGVYVWGFLGILLVYQLVNKETVTKKQYVFLALVTMLGCIGDALSVIMLVIPAVLYCGWELLSNACEKPRRYAEILGTTVAGMALSFVWDKLYYAIGTANKNSFLEQKAFENFEDLERKFWVYVHSVMGLNGADFSFQSLLSVNTIFYFLKTILVIMVFGIMIYNIVNFVKRNHKDVISELLSLGFVFISIVFVMTTVSSNIYSARYIGVCPVIFAILIIRYMRQKNIFECKITNKRVILWPLFVVLSVAFILNNGIILINQERPETEQQRVAEYLKTQDVKCGYGNFWDASYVTVMTKNETQIRPISINDNADIFKWASKDTWYDTEAQFIIVRNEEWVEMGVNYDNVIKVFGQPKEVKEFENYKIMIYNYDLSSKIQK